MCKHVYRHTCTCSPNDDHVADSHPIETLPLPPRHVNSGQGIKGPSGLLVKVVDHVMCNDGGLGSSQGMISFFPMDDMNRKGGVNDPKGVTRHAPLTLSLNSYLILGWFSNRI